MESSQQHFLGRTALVTGGARGIGRAIALALARGGARVAINFRTSLQDADQTVKQIRDSGATALAVRGDVSQADQVDQVVGEVTKELGPVELLVNNAAVFQLFPPGEQPLCAWEQTLKVNLTGAYLMTWAVKDAMLQRRFGRIVNISSIAALRERSRSIAYAVSKAGLTALTKCCAEAWAPSNVRVNAVAPGLIDTEMVAIAGPELLESLVQQTPMGRIGKPEDIAPVVEFLLSEKSNFITGQTVVACGGRVMLP